MLVGELDEVGQCGPGEGAGDAAVDPGPEELRRAGAVAVGVGTALLDRRAIENGDYGVLRNNAARIVANVRAARGLT